MSELIRTELSRKPKQANFPGYENDPVGYITKELRCKLTPQQIQICQALIQHKKVMVKGAHDTPGKCLHYNSNIYLTNGKRVQCRNLVDKQFELFTLGQTKTKAKAEWNQPEDIYEITVESGKTLRVNQQHPLWRATRSNGIDVNGWTPAGALEEGDLLALTKELPAFGTFHIPALDLILLAHLTVSTYKDSDSLIVIAKTQAQYDAVNEAVASKGGLLSSLYQDNRYLISHANHIEYAYWAYGLSHSFRDRKLPEQLFELNKEDTLLLLRHIFLTNTFTIKNDWESKLKFYHRSHQLVQDVAYLLLKFGIQTRIYQRDEFWVLRVINTEPLAKLLKLPYLAEGNPDQRLEWRQDKAPDGCYWERITEKKFYEKNWTVAIEVPEHNTYLTEFYEHNSFIAGALVNWNYDAFHESVGLTTAPNEDVVRDVIWGKIRALREKLPEEMWDLAPKDYRMQDGPNHFATGYIAAKEAASRGRKSPHMLLVFDEADGIRPEFFDSADGIVIARNALWLASLNPVHNDSRAALEEENFYVLKFSAFDHPNVVAELKAGRYMEPDELPFPEIGMNLKWVENMIAKKCRQIEESVFRLDLNDCQFPPPWMYEDDRYLPYLKSIGAEQPQFYRPKPLMEFEPRVLGEWSNASQTSVWTNSMIETCLIQQPLDRNMPVEIGCDPTNSAEGQDFVSFHVRRGKSSLHMESFEGWDIVEIAKRCKELATVYGHEAGMTAETVPIRLDTTSGDGAYALKGKFNFIPVNSSWKAAIDPDRYPNRRTELWAYPANLANSVDIKGNGTIISEIDFSRIQDSKFFPDLKRQLKVAEISLRAGGRLEVEPKLKMIKKLKRSPDDADAFNLAFTPYQNETIGGNRAILSSGAAGVMRDRFGSRFRK